MRFQLVDDIHLEFYHNLPKQKRVVDRIPVLADTIVLAGDILSLKFFPNAIEVVGLFCNRWKNVVFVRGNHCYYYGEWDQVNENFKQLEKYYSNLHCLETGKVVEIEGKRFLGDTMWFRDDPMDWFYKNGMNDFHVIKDFEKNVYKANRATLDFLWAEMRQGDIIVTHHLPHELCVNDIYKNDPMTRFFLCDNNKMIEQKKPAVWCFGHSHTSVDIKIHESRLVSNPHGYPSENWKDTGFRPDLVIEL
jgi:Icc-related predicted phosphoesterase